MSHFKNKLALSTSCLGLHPSHTLPSKLHAASAHNFHGIEIVYSDLASYAKTLNLPITTTASKVRTLCQDLNLSILSLCPFENYEGSHEPLTSRLKTASHWLEIARNLGSSHLQVPAQFSQTTSTDRDVIVRDLQHLSDLAHASDPDLIIAYEPMSWSTAISTWESALTLADAVDRPNFKICIDSFHIASKIWGSPCNTDDGKLENADAELEDSLRRFVRDFPLEKLAYVQLSDGVKFERPFSKDNEWWVEGEDVRFSWSKHGRPFPGERDLGGYMPVGQMLRALVNVLGFEGWVSLETFDWRMRDGEVRVEECAARAEKSVRRLEGEVLGVKASL